MGRTDLGPGPSASSAECQEERASFFMPGFMLTLLPPVIQKRFCFVPGALGMAGTCVILFRKTAAQRGGSRAIDEASARKVTSLRTPVQPGLTTCHSSAGFFEGVGNHQQEARCPEMPRTCPFPALGSSICVQLLCSSPVHSFIHSFHWSLSLGNHWHRQGFP